MRDVLANLMTKRYQFMLLLAAAIWGLGTVFIKGIVEDIPPFWLVGIRFFCAGLVFLSVFFPQLVRLHREERLFEHIRISLLLGVLMISGYMFNSWGLVGTTAANSSFLTGLYCVIVPFVAWIISRTRPTAFNIIAAVLCVVGVGLVSLSGADGFAMGWGDAVTLVSAVLMAIHLAATSKLAPGRNIMVLTFLQFLFGGALSMAFASFLEPVPSFEMLVMPEMIGSILYLILFATCAALLFQNIGLAKVPAASGSLLLSFESVFGVLFSIAILGEVITLPMLAGFSLIFVAVLVSEWLPGSAIMGKVRSKLDRAKLEHRSSSRPSRDRIIRPDSSAGVAISHAIRSARIGDHLASTMPSHPSTSSPAFARRTQAGSQQSRPIS